VYFEKSLHHFPDREALDEGGAAQRAGFSSAIAQIERNLKPLGAQESLAAILLPRKSRLKDLGCVLFGQTAERTYRILEAVTFAGLAD
jgi:hypothetical protein